MLREKNLRIYAWYSLSDLKHDQKRSVRFPSLIVPEMRPLGTFWSILSSGYHGNDDRYKNFDFSFGHVFPNSVNVQSFIARKKVTKDQKNFSKFLFLITLRTIPSTPSFKKPSTPVYNNPAC